MRESRDDIPTPFLMCCTFSEAFWWSWEHGRWMRLGECNAMDHIFHMIDIEPGLSGRADDT